jgi:hypothetical protein
LFRQEHLEIHRKSFKGTAAEFRASVEEDLNSIASGVREKGADQPSRMERWQAQQLDCFLYAQDDQYLKRDSELPAEEQKRKSTRVSGIEKNKVTLSVT